MLVRSCKIWFVFIGQLTDPDFSRTVLRLLEQPICYLEGPIGHAQPLETDDSIQDILLIPILFLKLSQPLSEDSYLPLILISLALVLIWGKLIEVEAADKRVLVIDASFDICILKLELVVGDLYLMRFDLLSRQPVAADPLLFGMRDPLTLELLACHAVFDTVSVHSINLT